MDESQLRRRLEWLDEQGRKDRDTMAKMQERLAAAQEEAAAQANRLDELEASLSAAQTLLGRVARLDDTLDKFRADLAGEIGAVEKRREAAERDAEKVRQIEREAHNRTLAELRKELELRLEREAGSRKDEDQRINRVVLELQARMEALDKYSEEKLRSITVLDEARRQDAKRIAEVQGEAAMLRKRMDEQKGKLETLEDMVRRADARLGELLAAEAERRAGQLTWMEQQTMAQAERERWWKEVRERIEGLVQKSEEFDRRMDIYAETHRMMKKAVDEYYQQVERTDRRIAELVEMQRLAEDRLRQDWAAFLADDQKRWTTHMLLRDEQWRDHDRLNARHVERLELLEDQMVEALDGLRLAQEREQSRLQTLIGLMRDWFTEHEQTFAKVR